MAPISLLTRLTSRAFCFTRLETRRWLIYCTRNISEAGFDLTLQGALTNIGPLDALIEFEEPLTYVFDMHA